MFCCFFNLFFSVRLLSVLRGHSDFSSPQQRPMTSDFEGFLYQILSFTLFSYLNLWVRASIFPLQCWVLNKGTSGTIFITSLVWRGPWLGIEPGTSRTNWFIWRSIREYLIYSAFCCCCIVLVVFLLCLSLKWLHHFTYQNDKAKHYGLIVFSYLTMII